MAEVEQPGIADDDVQTQAKHDVNQGEGADIHRAARAKHRDEKSGDDEQRQHPAPVIFNRCGGAETRVTRQAVFRRNGERQQQLRDEDHGGGIQRALPIARQRQPLRALLQMHAENGQGNEKSQRGSNHRIAKITHQTFSTSGLPRMPEGRISKTIINKEKATKSLYSLAK